MMKVGKAVSMVAVGLVMAITIADVADARRAGNSSGFGSRGARTDVAPPVTNTAPTTAAPIQRSMTPAAQPGAAAAAATPSRGLFGGMAGGLMGGLVMGGLIGMMLGGGFGGMAGLFGMLLQLLLIGGLVMLAMRFFAARRQAAAYSGGPTAGPQPINPFARNGAGTGPVSGGPSGAPLGFGGSAAAGQDAGASPVPRVAAPTRVKAGTDLVGLTQRDFEIFEELLKDLQAAYSAEDYSALRRITTPEAMSYLAEELGENATKGLRNDVSGVTLLQGDLAEAWREGTIDYATVAMRYEAIDVMRDRTTGAVVEGNPGQAESSVEVWTFVRRPGAGWSISAIQAA